MNRVNILILFILLSCARKEEINFSLINSVTKDKYGDVNGVILFDSTKVYVKEDGTPTYLIHNMVKILSTYGKKKFGEVEFPYYKQMGKVDIILARVITSDGKIINVGKENIKEIPFVPAEWRGGKFIFRDVMNKKIIFPSIDIGATIEYCVKYEMEKPLMMNKFCDIVIFKDYEPIMEKVYQIEFPNEMAMKFIIKNGELPFYKEEKENNIIYKWVVKNIEKALEEPLMPPLSVVEPTLIISNIEKWEDISRWYYELSESTFVANDEIKSKVKELTKDAKTDDEKIKNLFEFVSKEINYVRTEAISKDKGFAPDHSSLTFTRKWGVCRDKAALLVSMLKEIGVDAYIVLINVTHRTPREVPTYLFEHAIVAIKKADGSYYYLDPTVEYTREYLPSMEEDKDLLICTPDGDNLRYIPYSHPERELMIVDNVGKLSEDGELKATMKMKGEGIFDASLRGFRYLSNEERKQLFETMIKSLSPQAKVDTIIFSDFEDLTKPFETTIYYSLPDFAIKKNNELHIITSGAAFSGSSGICGQVGNILTEKRKYPIYFGTPMTTKVITKIALPKGYKIKEIQEPLKLENENILVQSEKNMIQDTLLATTQYVIKEPFIPVEKYFEFKDIMEKFESYQKKATILEKKLK